MFSAHVHPSDPKQFMQKQLRAIKTRLKTPQEMDKIHTNKSTATLEQIQELCSKQLASIDLWKTPKNLHRKATG